MTTSRVPSKRSHGLIAAGLLTASLAFLDSTGLAHPEGPAATAAYLDTLVQGGALTETQHDQIHHFYETGNLNALDSWLDAQERAGRMTSDTRLYVDAVLKLTPPNAELMAPAPAGYSGNGNVTLLGQLNSQPPSPYYGDNSTTGTLYSGIWGYAAGTREYALQCNSFGLHIIDVTTPSSPFQVQYIDMSGGVSPPKGRIWRDVDIHFDAVSGKTYAYVGAQSNGNLWIIDLSYLSDSTPNGVDSNPIPPAAIADRGRTNYGHTMFINDGLLFMNSANNASTLGCQIFDLEIDPFNPPIIGTWGGSGHDCHDSFARTNVSWAGGKDLLYSADGYATRYRILDITNIRTGTPPTLLGETAAVSGIYSHSNWPTNDAHYLYAFDEFNVRDIGVYDVSNPASPTQLTTFQYSEDATANARIHNGQVIGNYLYTAYYEAGFRVFDISNPMNAVEVGKYETWRDPDGDGTFNRTVTGNYNGAWNVHVYLPSGKVILSDMLSGTFIFHVDPIAVPGATSGLGATPGPTQVALSWTAVSRAAGYSVKRSTTAGGPYTTIKANAVGTSYTDTGLTNGTTYYYVVSATNAEGEGGNSSEVSAVPAGAPVGPPYVITEVAQKTNYGGSTSDKVEILCVAVGGCAAYRECEGTLAFGSRSCSANQAAMTQGQRVVISRGTSIATNEYVWIETTAGVYVTGTQVGTFNCATGASRSRQDCNTATFAVCGTPNLGASSGTCP